MRLFHARWVLPISRPPIRHGTVAVHDDGRIGYVGSRDAAPEGPSTELGDSILLPGLVNAHTHLELTVMRGFLEELRFREWLLGLTTARRAVLSSDDLLDSARAGILEGLSAGITTYADTSGSGVTLEAMRELGVRGVMYQEVFGPAPSQCAEMIAGLRARVGELRALETPLVRVGVSPHAPYSVSDALFSATAELAVDEALPMAIHVAESEMEMRFVRDGAGEFADSLTARGIVVQPRARSPIALLEHNGALDARPLLIHCVRLDGDDVDTIARHRCAVAHCPVSNAKLGHGIAPLVELLDHGIAVGLGSDSVASNNRMDLLEEARHALLAQRARLLRHDALDSSAVLRLATLGGAEALGLEHQVGSLDPGKQADLVAFSLDPLRSIADGLPADTLVHSISGRPASLVVVAGRVLVEGGVPIHSSAGVVERVARAARRLAAWRDRLA